MIWKVVQQLHLAHAVARVRIEDVLHRPRQGPEDVPLFVLGSFDPASFLEVLRQHAFVEISFVAELVLCRLHF